MNYSESSLKDKNADRNAESRDIACEISEENTGPIASQCRGYS